MLALDLRSLSAMSGLMAVAKRLVAEAGVGLAPGDAFGPEGRGWLRWCIASKDVNRLAEGVRRLQQWLESNRAA